VVKVLTIGNRPIPSGYWSRDCADFRIGLLVKGYATRSDVLDLLEKLDDETFVALMSLKDAGTFAVRHKRQQDFACGWLEQGAPNSRAYPPVEEQPFPLLVDVHYRLPGRNSEENVRVCFPMQFDDVFVCNETSRGGIVDENEGICGGAEVETSITLGQPSDSSQTVGEPLDGCFGCVECPSDLRQGYPWPLPHEF
jgi:hypothetical protein